VNRRVADCGGKAVGRRPDFCTHSARVSSWELMTVSEAHCFAISRANPCLAPEKTSTCPNEDQTPARIRGENMINGGDDDRRCEMRFLVSALFGKSGSKANELDAFMRRLDRIAAERGKAVTRRATA
jgi:hypothetical protein